MSLIRLSTPYEVDYSRLLEHAAEASVPDSRLTPFWPVSGLRYTGELLVIGRSVNGWVEDWAAQELRQPDVRDEACRVMRTDAERTDRCRMLWVTDLAGRTENPYNTNRSAFWRVLRALVYARHDDPDDRVVWPSFLTWTNLYKISPAAGWNPGADLQIAQRDMAVRLLRREIDEFAPRRVLALTGGWIRPFEAAVGIQLDWREGLVEAIGRNDGVAWVVAKHPMGKPGKQWVDEVLDAFARLDAPLRSVVAS